MQIQKKIGCVCLLLSVAANSDAEILTSRDMIVTVDKVAQTKLLNSQLAEFDKLYGSTAALLRNLETQISHQKQNLEKIHVEIKALNVDLLKQNDERFTVFG